MDLQLFQGVNTQDLINALIILGKGMASILGVLILIAILVVILTKATSRKPEDPKIGNRE